MNIQKLIEYLQNVAEKHPDAEVRLETYDQDINRGSIVNRAAVVCVKLDSKKVTIVGDGIRQKY